MKSDMYPLYNRPNQADLEVLVDIDSSVFRTAIGNVAMAGCDKDIKSTGTGVLRGVA